MDGWFERDRSRSGRELRPIWENSGSALYQGESLRLLDELRPQTFDAVITDPPYCSGGTSIAERQRDPADKYCQNGNTCGRPTFVGDCRDQRSFKFWCMAWLMFAREATKVGGRLLAFIDWRQLPTLTDAVQAAGWTWRSVGVWNKGRGSRAPHKGYLRHQCEYIVYATNGPCPPAENGPFDGCYDVPVDRKEKLHITGKPTPLMRQLVQVVEPGGLILDPFAGSCTTALAALQEGRRCLSIEATPEYCAIGAKRLRESAEPAPGI